MRQKAPILDSPPRILGEVHHATEAIVFPANVHAVKVAARAARVVARAKVRTAAQHAVDLAVVLVDLGVTRIGFVPVRSPLLHIAGHIEHAVRGRPEGVGTATCGAADA